MHTYIHILPFSFTEVSLQNQFFNCGHSLRLETGDHFGLRLRHLSRGRAGERGHFHCGVEVTRLRVKRPHLTKGVEDQVCVCVCVCIYPSIHISMYICIYLSTYLPTYLPTYLYVSICIYLYLSLSLSLYRYIRTSISTYLYIFIYLSYLYIFIYLCIRAGERGHFHCGVEVTRLRVERPHLVTKVSEAEDHVGVWVSFSLSIHLSVYLSIYVSVCIYMYLPISISISILSLSTILYLYLYIYRDTYIYISISISVYISKYSRRGTKPFSWPHRSHAASKSPACA